VRSKLGPSWLLTCFLWNTIAELRIRNIGSTLATNVQFQFDPQLESTRDSEPGREKPIREANLFAKGIPSLAPGNEIVVFFDQLPTRIQGGPPEDYFVTVTYSDPLGKEHSDTMTAGYSHRLELGRITRHDVHDIQRLEEIVREVKKWSAFGGGIKVMTADDLRREREEWEAEYARRVAAQDEESVSSMSNGEAS
jgi:hypothetical protein